MTADFPVFASDEAIRSIGRRLLDRTLPEPEWTHAAHCVATLYLLRECRDIDVGGDLPGIIWRYNEASGTANTDSGDYHETITRFYLRALAAFLARMPADLKLFEICNLVLASRFGARDFPLDYYSRERLFSVEARRVWVAPDRATFDFECLELPVSAG